MIGINLPRPFFEPHHRVWHGDLPNKERLIVAFASLDYSIPERAWVASLHTYLSWWFTFSRTRNSLTAEETMDPIDLLQIPSTSQHVPVVTRDDSR